MKHEIQFNKEDTILLRGVIAAQAKKDIRYYLNGVCFNDKHVVATDGHRLALMPAPYNDLNDNYIIGGLKIKVATNHVIITIDGNQATVEEYDRKGNKTAAIYQIIDGWYPDYMGVMVKEKPHADDCKGVPLGFNALLLADMQKALKSKSCSIYPTNATDGFRVEFNGIDPDFVYVVMPCKL